MVLSGRMQLVLALVVVFTGCGGGDGPTDPGSDPTGGNGNTGGRTIKDNPSFSNDVVEIFVRRGCTDGSCHGGAQGGLHALRHHGDGPGTGREGRRRRRRMSR